MNDINFKGIFDQTISNEPNKVLYEYYTKGEIVEITYKQLVLELQHIEPHFVHVQLNLSLVHLYR